VPEAAMNSHKRSAPLAQSPVNRGANQFASPATVPAYCGVLNGRSTSSFLCPDDRSSIFDDAYHRDFLARLLRDRDSLRPPPLGLRLSRLLSLEHHDGLLPLLELPPRAVRSGGERTGSIWPRRKQHYSTTQCQANSTFQLERQQQASRVKRWMSVTFHSHGTKKAAVSSRPEGCVTSIPSSPRCSLPSTDTCRSLSPTPPTVTWMEKISGVMGQVTMTKW
jgi:hypothetical protein